MGVVVSNFETFTILGRSLSTGGVKGFRLCPPRFGPVDPAEQATAASSTAKAVRPRPHTGRERGRTALMGAGMRFPCKLPVQ